MAGSRTLARLLGIRNLAEHQKRQALESALGELRRLEQALVFSAGRERESRRLLAASAVSGQVADRVSALEEAQSARRHASALGPRIAQAAGEAAERRDEFLVSRVERRQAETLLEEARALEAIDAARRVQQSLDDRYGASRSGDAAKDR
jgi:hypothetical protein